MILKSTLLLVLILCCSIPLLAQIPKVTPAPLENRQDSGQGCSLQSACAEVAPGMIKSALGPSPLEENLRYLTDTIGGRVSGTPSADKAVGWAVEAFRKAKVDEVHTEKFTMPVSWSEGRTRIEVTSPEAFPVRAVSIAWSPATPEAGIDAPVADLGFGEDADFTKAGASISGAILLIHSKFLTTFNELDAEYDVVPPIVARAAKAGAVAIFWMSSRPSLLLYRHTVSVDGQLEKLPQAVLAREDAERMARFLAAGNKIRVHFDMPNHIGGPVTSENVVAELRGREKPNEFVLLGAHLDSWDLGTGALDNGCNAAMVIDAARVIHASGVIPRRSIRFVLFTGEEQGLLGSAAYAHAHRSELDQMVAAIIFDSGIGKVSGFALAGRKDIEAPLREMLQPVASLGVKDFTFDAAADTDNFDFMLEGVPTLVANQEPANYMLNYHAASDTFDKVDIAAVKQESAIAAVTAFALADSPDRLGPRQSRSEVQQLLNQTGIMQWMKDTGFLPYWERAERGREP